jgi:ribosomal 30S subunit maturation factor RimM
MNNPDKEKKLPPGESRESANWAHDIEDREYYYDDSTGYEVYDPDKEEVEEEPEGDETE